eukprot:750038-Hanusia_phi.AAC.5
MLWRWGKALIIRHAGAAWLNSIVFEFVEMSFEVPPASACSDDDASLQHWMPNFAECWWDHIILDVLTCNLLGICLGHLFMHWLAVILPPLCISLSPLPPPSPPPLLPHHLLLISLLLSHLLPNHLLLFDSSVFSTTSFFAFPPGFPPPSEPPPLYPPVCSSQPPPCSLLSSFRTSFTFPLAPYPSHFPSSLFPLTISFPPHLRSRSSNTAGCTSLRSQLLRGSSSVSSDRRRGGREGEEVQRGEKEQGTEEEQWFELEVDVVNRFPTPLVLT